MMRLFWIKLTCDHDVLVAADSPEAAFLVAEEEAEDHTSATEVDREAGADEVFLDTPCILAVVDGF